MENTSRREQLNRLRSTATKLARQASEHTAKGLRQAAEQGRELAKKINEEPGRATAKRLVEAVLGDWVDGGVGAQWTDDDETLTEDQPATSGASLRVNWRKGEIELKNVQLKQGKTLQGLGFGHLKVGYGRIDRAIIVVPWTNLGSASVSLSLHNVNLKLEANTEANLVDDTPNGSTNTDILELVDSLRAKLGTAAAASSSTSTPTNTPSKPLRGSLLRRGARKVALRALSAIEVQVTGLELTYAQLLGCSLDSAQASLVSLGGDSFTTTASLQGLTLFQDETHLAALASLHFRLGEERMANIKPSGLEIYQPIHVLTAAKEARASLYTAWRLFDASGQTKRRYPDMKHYIFRRAVVALMTERKRALRRWFEAVDLVILRAEYLECRAEEATSKSARKRTAEIEANTPLRTLLAFRCEPDDFETSTTESVAILLDSADATLGDLRLQGLRLASTDDKPLDNCRIYLQSISGLIETTDISFDGGSSRLVFANPLTVDLPDLSSAPDLSRLFALDDQPSRPKILFTASAPAIKLKSTQLEVSLINPCFQDSTFSVTSLSLDGLLSLSANELRIAMDRVHLASIAGQGLSLDHLEYVYKEQSLSLASLNLIEASAGARLIQAWRQLDLNIDLNCDQGSNGDLCLSVAKLALGDILRAEKIHYSSKQGLTWCAADIGGQALTTSGCTVMFSDDEYRVELADVCKCKPTATVAALKTLVRDWCFWSNPDSDTIKTANKWIVKVPRIAVRVEPPEPSEDEVIQEDELEAIDLDAPEVGATGRPLLVTATDLKIDSDWHVRLGAISVASVSDCKENILEANTVSLHWGEALIQVSMEKVAAVESVRLLGVYFTPPTTETEETKARSTSVELTVVELKASLAGAEVHALNLAAMTSGDAIDTMIQNVSVRREGNLLVDGAVVRTKVSSEVIELGVESAHEVYLAPADLQSLSLGGASESRRRLSVSIAGETHLYLCSTKVPALRLALRDIVLETRPGYTAGLTLALAAFDRFDDRKEVWHGLLLDPCQLCFQHLPEEARLCLNGIRLRVDSGLVSAVSRLRGVSLKEILEIPASFRVHNECGVEMQVNDATLAAGEVLELELPPQPERRDGAASPGLKLGASGLIVPLPRRAIVSGVQETLLVPGWGLEIEISQGAVRLRSAQRLKNDCADKLICRAINNDNSVVAVTAEADVPLEIAPGDEADLPLSWLRPRRRLVVWRENIDAEWLDCGDLVTSLDSEWLDCSELLRNQEEDQAILWSMADDITSQQRDRLQKKNLYQHRSLRYRVTFQKWEESSTRVSRRLVVSPRRRLRNKLSVIVRIATARRWPESREDYADLFDVKPGAYCDLGDARFWCLRLEGYTSQSDWQDCAGVLSDQVNETSDEPPPTARFIVRSEERGALALELRRQQKHEAGELELVCSLTVEDRGTGLDLDLETRMLLETSESETMPLQQRECVYRRGPIRKLMLDVSPHAAVVAVSRRFEFGQTPPRSSPLVLAAALARNQGSTTVHSRLALAGPDGLFELGFFQPNPRLVVFVPRLLLVNEMTHGADVVVRQAGVNVYRASRAAPGEVAPIYWDRPSAPFALDFGIALSDRAAPQQWTTVSAARFEETELSELLSSYDKERAFNLMVRRGTSRATFELVVCDLISNVVPAPVEVGVNKAHLNSVQRLLNWSRSARLEIESLELVLSEALLTLKTPTGFSTTLRRGKGGVCHGTMQLQATAIVDEGTHGLAFQNYYDDREAICFKLTGRFSPDGIKSGSLAAALELGDAALDLDEAAAWRLLDAVRMASEAWDNDSKVMNDNHALYETELVRLGGWRLRPATVRADAVARRRLLEALDDLDGPVNVLTRNLVGALPKLGLENAEFLFEPCELRPRQPQTVSDLLADVGRTYAAQLKRQWFSLASSLSLPFGGRARSAPISAGTASTRRPMPPQQVEEAPVAPPSEEYLFEYSVLVQESGALGLVIIWRDGIVSVAQTKESCELVAAALAPVRAGDVILAVNGTSAQRYSSSEQLVSVLRLRPLEIRLARPRVAFLDILVPAAEPSLGFSIARRVIPSIGPNPVLVVTDVRSEVAAAKAGVQPGSRLLAINGEPVAHLDLDQLIAKAKPLAHTDRTVSIAIDNYYPPQQHETQIAHNVVTPNYSSSSRF